MLEKKKYTYTNFEIKTIYEFLNKMFISNGIDIETSKFVVKNLKNFDGAYQEISKGIYNPNTDPKVKEYNNEIAKLMTKYADRDANGNIIMNGNEPRITDNAVEFNNELKELQTKYNEVIAMAQNADGYNQKFLANTREVEVDTWHTANSFSEKIPPFLMFYFAREDF